MAGTCGDKGVGAVLETSVGCAGVGKTQQLK